MTPLMLTTHTPLYNYFTTCRHCCPLTVLPSACRPPAGSGCPATGLLCEQGSGAGGGSHWQGTARWQGGRTPSFAGSTASGETCREAPPQLVSHARPSPLPGVYTTEVCKLSAWWQRGSSRLDALQSQSRHAATSTTLCSTYRPFLFPSHLLTSYFQLANPPCPATPQSQSAHQSLALRVTDIKEAYVVEN